MYELYEYDGNGEWLVDTFETRDELVRYMTENHYYAEEEDGFFGLCPNGEEINL